MIFYTADPHFRYEPMVAGRPFETVEEMDEAIIANWNAVVGPEDTVYLIGDIGFNGGHVPCRTLARLNGRKHLIRGNHDTGFEDAPLLYRYFESVTDFLEIDDGPHHIFLSHYPILYIKPVGYMIHGHLHKSGQLRDILGAFPRILNAGMDINNFAPVTLEQLIENNRLFYSQPLEEQPYHRKGKGLLPGKADFRPLPIKPEPHRKHLFLTGPKQIGKSTALTRLLEGRDAKIGGFRTRRIRTADGASIHMLPPVGEEVYTDENRLFYKRRGQIHLDPADFDRLGRKMLADSRDCDLLLMDELGPNEAQSQGFQQAVLAALDGETSVYGVLQLAESDFLDQIKARPDVTVITVTAENREDLPRKLLEKGW
ncbi:MAG: hypothetical protein IJX69_03240 [Oscillospiraceae bacterium]|nr:hypothetical protein [Oscillospiraceae bacterium]